MKILTEKEQLRNKLSEIELAIESSLIEMNRVYSRRERKTNWGIFSFISDPYWLLDATLKKKQTQVKLLEEYRDIISDRLVKQISK
jgi:hypothetical protein